MNRIDFEVFGLSVASTFTATRGKHLGIHNVIQPSELPSNAVVSVLQDETLGWGEIERPDLWLQIGDVCSIF